MTTIHTGNDAPRASTDPPSRPSRTFALKLDDKDGDGSIQFSPGDMPPTNVIRILTRNALGRIGVIVDLDRASTLQLYHWIGEWLVATKPIEEDRPFEGMDEDVLVAMYDEALEGRDWFTCDCINHEWMRRVEEGPLHQ